jgi:Septum formation
MVRRTVACASLLVVGVAGLAGCGDDGGDEDGAEATTTTVLRSTAEEAPVSSGDCGNVPRLQVGGALDPATIELVGCDEPHLMEIGAVFEYPLGLTADFPGTTNVDGFATQECLEQFEAYVGTPYTESDLDVLIIAPDEDGWDDGDRRVACVLYDTDFEEITGSVAGSGR